MASLVSAAARRFWWLALVVVLASGCLSSAPDTSTRIGTEAPAPVVQGAVLHEGPPGPDDDFPMLPGHCQSPTEPMPFTPCHVTSYGSHRPTVAVWGDSHAWMYLPALRQAAVHKKVNLVMILAGGCPPALPRPRVAGQPYTQCEAHDTRAMDYVRALSARATPFRLILGAFWSGYRQGYAGGFLDDGTTSAAATYAQRLDYLAHHRTKPLFDALGRLKVAVDVIGQAATVPPDAAPCPAGRDPYDCDVPRSSALTSEADNRAWLEGLMQPLAGHPLYIDTTPAYCDATVCHATVDGVHTWYDDIHLGKDLTRRMTSYFRPAFDDLG